ncbi:MAG: ABC transporter permease [Nitriliruptor sp.]|uniref:ABC transporter permease n=1 Tax=Nitriliruptor sp. TaxID=2448056 RepID=UPI0034A0AAB6
MAVDAPLTGAAAGRGALRTSSRKLGELWRARELLGQLVRKELKVRYKNSSLGFLWSMLTPALMTVVFSIVFTRIVRVPVDDFAAFFLAGYLLWQFFQNSCQGAIHSVVGNGDLVKKVYFPREVLPLSHVLSQLAHLLLALLVVSPYLIATRGWGLLVHLPATLLAIALLTVFTSGVAMLLAGVNVVFRDLQELFVVLYLVWFYATPVLYPMALVEAELAGDPLSWVGTILLINPMTWFVEAFRTPLYGAVVVSSSDAAHPVVSMLPTWPSLGNVAVMVLWALGALIVGYVVFLRRARTFAKEV